MIESHAQFTARRGLLKGALVLAVGMPALRPLRARAANAFDGTWAAIDANGETVQITFVNGDIIGFYWRGDYLDASSVKLGDAGSTLSFAFTGGQAVVTRNDVGMTMIIHDKRGVSKVSLKRD
jgi:hypothetical protein